MIRNGKLINNCFTPSAQRPTAKLHKSQTSPGPSFLRNHLSTYLRVIICNLGHSYFWHSGLAGLSAVVNNLSDYTQPGKLMINVVVPALT